MHEVIWYFSYKMRKGQFLSQAMNNKKKDCTTKFFNKSKHLQPNMLCFSEIVNSQKNHWLAFTLQDALIVIKTKYPVRIMVFWVVISDGDVMLPFTCILPHGLILNTEANIKCL